MSTLPCPRDSFPWGAPTRQRAAHVVAVAAAFAVAAWIRLPLPGKPARRIVRHDDGYLAIHVLERSDRWEWCFQAWHEGNVFGEQAIKANVSGYLVEVWYTDPKAAAAEVLRIAARRV